MLVFYLQVFYENMDLHVTVPYFHGFRETRLTLPASAAQVPSAEEMLSYRGGSVTQCWLDYVPPVTSTSMWEYSKEKRITKLL